MEERFTKLNDFYRPAVETALRPFTAAPAAAGERRLQKTIDTLRNMRYDVLVGALFYTQFSILNVLQKENHYIYK